MLPKNGEQIKQRVRDFFKKGHKSNNKLYDVSVDGSADLSTMSVKGNKRWMEANESDKYRLKGAASDY